MARQAASAQQHEQQRRSHDAAWLQACGQGVVLPRLVAAERALLTAAKQPHNKGAAGRQRPLVVVPGLPALRAAAAAEAHGANQAKEPGSMLHTVSSMPRELRSSVGSHSHSGRDSAAVLRSLSGRPLHADDSQSSHAAEGEESCSSFASWQADLLPL